MLSQAQQQDFGDISSATRQLEVLRGDRASFGRLAAILKRLTGINLQPTDKNLSLMAARVAPLLRRTGTTGYPDLAARLEGGNPSLVEEFICALTTNTTEFFREAKHFSVMTDEVKARLPEKSRAGDFTLRIWCAACSSGQEIYTTLMALHEAIPALSGWTLKVLATDIDRDILDRAAGANYSEAEVLGVPPMLRQKYFVSEPAGDVRRFTVARNLRSAVTFAPFNLMQSAYPFKHPFDVIFCRNVMIYFERDAAAAVARRLFGCLAPGGTLFLGHSETGLLKGPDVEGVATAAYRRVRS